MGDETISDREDACESEDGFSRITNPRTEMRHRREWGAIYRIYLRGPNLWPSNSFLVLRYIIIAYLRCEIFEIDTDHYVVRVRPDRGLVTLRWRRCE